jgi:hypothetical protein
MNQKNSSIGKAALLAGTLDILAAFVFVFIKTGKPHIFDILKFIASGVFGKAASTGGAAVILAGLLFHFFIATLFTVFFFWIFPKIKISSKNKLVTGIIYGVFVWSIMNLIVVPLSNVAPRPFSLTNALINIGILMICIGIPLSFLADSYYKKISS